MSVRKHLRILYDGDQAQSQSTCRHYLLFWNAIGDSCAAFSAKCKQRLYTGYNPSSAISIVVLWGVVAGLCKVIYAKWYTTVNVASAGLSEITGSSVDGPRACLVCTAYSSPMTSSHRRICSKTHSSDSECQIARNIAVLACSATRWVR